MLVALSNLFLGQVRSTISELRKVAKPSRVYVTKRQKGVWAPLPSRRGRGGISPDTSSCFAQIINRHLLEDNKDTMSRWAWARGCERSFKFKINAFQNVHSTFFWGDSSATDFMSERDSFARGSGQAPRRCEFTGCSNQEQNKLIIRVFSVFIIEEKKHKIINLQTFLFCTTCLCFFYFNSITLTEFVKLSF